jgi:hypothetical protein
MKQFLIFLFSLSILLDKAQNNLSLAPDSVELKKYIFEVKQMDQFILRFNGEENILTGKSKSQTDISLQKKNSIKYKEERNKILIALFDQQTFNTIDKIPKDFINYIINDSAKIKLSYYDNDWYSSVNCTIIYKGKSQTIGLTLKPEGSIKSGYKWVIIGVKQSFYNINPSRKDSSTYIGPSNHELSFMGLSKVFSDSQNISEYTNKDYLPDDLSIFLYLAKNNHIQFVQVNSQKYHLLQINNWLITVDYFNRDKLNSGWLISTIIKANNLEKRLYKLNELSIR